MNFKKVLSIASVASIAVVGLVSCGGSDNGGSTVEEYTGNINIALNYNNGAYATYGRASGNGVPATYTTIDNAKTLISGQSLTPVWQDIATNMNCSFTDTALEGKSAEASMISTINASYKGKDSADVDMLMITTADEYISAVNAGGFVNLSNYIDQMPNLKAWLYGDGTAANPGHQSIADQMLVGSDKGIYFTPYFDGIDQVEKGFNMNAEMVRSLLNADETVEGNAFKHSASYDTTTTINTQYGGQGSGATKSYIQSLSNQEIAVYDPNGKVGGTEANGWAGKITISITKDIATIQNELTTKNGATLTDALSTYIQTVYGEYIGTGKLYEHPSDIFTSASACYNADELIALLRCVKANPQYLTGTDEVTPLFPRTGEYNRASIMFEVSQMFGLRGTNGENGRFWINEAGEVVDTCTQTYALDCVEKMATLQNEKLLPTTSYWQQDGSSAGSDYRAVQMQAGTCFMTYDYLNVAAYNQDAMGSTYVTKEMQGVLPPVAKWPMTKDYEGNTIVGATSNGYSYTRFTEDNRSLKNSGWSICASVASNPSKLAKCLKIMDYMYSTEGSILECYGVNMQDPNATKNADGSFKSNAYASEIKTDAAGVIYPVLTQTFKDEKTATVGGTWHNYMTRYLGSCIGIGNIRSNYLESQLTGSYQLVGTEKYASAQGAGAMYLATTYGTNFLASVPTAISYTENQQTSINSKAADLENWWKIDKTSSTNKLWSSPGMLMTIYLGGFDKNTDSKTRDQVEALFANYNDSKLKYTATQWGYGTKYATTNQYSFLNN